MSYFFYHIIKLAVEPTLCRMDHSAEDQFCFSFIFQGLGSCSVPRLICTVHYNIENVFLFVMNILSQCLFGTKNHVFGKATVHVALISTIYTFIHLYLYTTPLLRTVSVPQNLQCVLCYSFLERFQSLWPEAAPMVRAAYLCLDVGWF